MRPRREGFHGPPGVRGRWTTPGYYVTSPIAKMPDSTRVTCKICGRHSRDAGPISWKGYCGTCGPEKAHKAAADMHHHHGEFFERWRRSMVACVGGRLVEEVGAAGRGVGERADGG